MQGLCGSGMGGVLRRSAGWPLVLGLAGVLALGGCSPISIAPVCPNSLRAGESGPVVANVQNPKAIASYQWEVLPPEAGSFDDPSAPNTRFTPSIEGDVVLRLTASDGLFQVISQCVTSVSGAVGASVGLRAEPAAAVVGDVVTLTCSSTGTFDVAVFAITQTQGADVVLTQESPSVATFIASAIGDLTFGCVGETGGGVQTDPDTVTVTVSEVPPDSNPPEDGTSGTGSDGTGDGGTGLPPRGGGRRVRG